MSTDSKPPPGVSEDSHCPDDGDLSSWSVGDLPRERFDELSLHVERCDRCQGVLGNLEANDDDLIAELGTVAHLSADDTGPAIPEPLLRAALSVHDGAGDGAPLVVDPGRRFAKALADGSVRLGKFELEEELGFGSFGHVFRARDTELDRIVAVKIQRAGNLGTREDRDRFLREARSAAQLEHPGIVSLYETGETEDDICYLVTEFVAGATLEERLEQSPFTPKDAGALLERVAEALQYAHGHGIVHRDLKPSNIMIDANGKPHLMDFGLAKRDTGEVTVTPEGEVMGTPAYMSPEQARGDSHHVDARSDIYSLGVILYELLTGNRPFQGNRRMVMLQLLEDEPRPPRALNERVPRDLETICLKAMAKSPHRRYVTSAELQEDLRRFRGGEPISARPVGRAERLWRWSRRNPLAASLLIALTLGSATGFTSLWMLSKSLVKSTALDSIGMLPEAMEQVNNIYSEIVADIERRDEEGTTDDGHDEIEVTHEYIRRAGSIPLPATFTIEAGRRISAASETGMLVRLYSDYPFPWRDDGGPQDDFERNALASLREDPSTPYHEFTTYDGKPALRHATARVMKKSCLGCHNYLPESPKKDWQEGDVRGVLEFIRIIERDQERTRDGLLVTFLLVGAASGVPLALTVFFLILGNRSTGRRSSP